MHGTRYQVRGTIGNRVIAPKAVLFALVTFTLFAVSDLLASMAYPGDIVQQPFSVLRTSGTPELFYAAVCYGFSAMFTYATWGMANTLLYRVQNTAMRYGLKLIGLGTVAHIPYALLLQHTAGWLTDPINADQFAALSFFLFYGLSCAGYVLFGVGMMLFRKPLVGIGFLCVSGCVAVGLLAELQHWEPFLGLWTRLGAYPVIIALAFLAILGHHIVMTDPNPRPGDDEVRFEGRKQTF
ncbi:hypothetical protein [Stomatohabitans albus]|uniref:hypothetical protein n=1 Tax=Stomatohabitans albus TaxID=3110766 RepID=UPI00300DA0AE